MKFYINKIKYINGVENADINFIPPIARRRMSNLDKVTAASLKACLSSDIQNIVYASQKGELERLLAIISQYQTQGVVSPLAFSGSVHNSAVSFFLLNEKLSLPYTSISAGDETFVSGLLSAIVSKYDNNLFVYSDIFDDKYISICINISKTIGENCNKFILKQENNKGKSCQFKDFIYFFDEKNIKFESPVYTLERVGND